MEDYKGLSTQKELRGKGCYGLRSDGRWRLSIYVRLNREKLVQRSFYGKSKEECREKAEEFVKPRIPSIDSTFIVQGLDFASCPYWLRQMYSKASLSAKRRGIEFQITKEQFAKLFERSNGKCMFSGIPFSFEKHGGKRCGPYAPSLDRIDSSKGYTVGNCRFICVLLNYAFHNWGSRPFSEIVRRLNAGNGTHNGITSIED